MRCTPAALQVEVLTVDSCQGSEFDYVVLSTVRANRMASIGAMQTLTYADVCWRMLTYADVCWRMDYVVLLHNRMASQASSRTSSG